MSVFFVPPTHCSAIFMEVRHGHSFLHYFLWVSKPPSLLFALCLQTIPTHSFLIISFPFPLKLLHCFHGIENARILLQKQFYFTSSILWGHFPSIIHWHMGVLILHCSSSLFFLVHSKIFLDVNIVFTFWKKPFTNHIYLRNSVLHTHTH